MANKTAAQPKSLVLRSRAQFLWVLFLWARSKIKTFYLHKFRLNASHSSKTEKCNKVTEKEMPPAMRTAPREKIWIVFNFFHLRLLVVVWWQTLCVLFKYVDAISQAAFIAFYAKCKYFTARCCCTISAIAIFFAAFLLYGWMLRGNGLLLSECRGEGMSS